MKVNGRPAAAACLAAASDGGGRAPQAGCRQTLAPLHSSARGTGVTSRPALPLLLPGVLLIRAGAAASSPDLLGLRRQVLALKALLLKEARLHLAPAEEAALQVHQRLCGRPAGEGRV